MLHNPSSHHALSDAVRHLLRPLIRILIRHGISFGTFAEIARQLFVEIARKEFSLPGRKQSISRVSVLTGLTRKDVRRLWESDGSKAIRGEEQYNRAARVITGWIRDELFLDANGQPATLPIDGAGASFAELVKRFSGDMPIRAVHDELLRVGAIEKVEDNRIKLVTRAFVPKDDEIMKFQILGTDVRHLIATIEHNLQVDGAPRFFQRKVSYDNLPVEALAAFQKSATPAAQRLLERFDKWLSKRDRDVNPDAGGTGRYLAGMGVYYFEKKIDDK